MTPYRRKRLGWTPFGFSTSLLLSLCLVHSGCFNNQASDGYYGAVVVPQSQEFRWSDGGVPRTFDPAFAAAPPDTDAVRAIFEGLTDYDPKTLAPIPGVAKRWESTDEGRVWTFYLRNDARWSNGQPVTAQDFVRSWQRTVRIGQLSPHTELLTNIEGARSPLLTSTSAEQKTSPRAAARSRRGLQAAQPFGAQAVGDHILRVRLRRADNNFPALVAHSVFRPVKVEDEHQLRPVATTDLVSNGPFLLARSDNNSVLLERANQYWGRSTVELERVEFVGTRDAEAALAAYRAGKIDAISNAPFEPLALKLLAPYKDFRRNTYGALTYYSFNTSKPPFDDVRVREAFAIAIDRERISRDDLDNATEPARKFLPEAMSGSNPVVQKSELLDQDARRAKELLASAGYPNGNGFPVVRLLINRNEQQRIVAQSVAAMWSSVLNVKTEILLRSWDEYETQFRAGDYEIARRGIVMQTTDEFTNLRMMFRHETSSSTPGETSERRPQLRGSESANISSRGQDTPIDSEAEALNQLRAMPIYFASSYSLVRPYVAGFDSNVLDVPSLKSIRIETNWREINPAR